ncbi:COX assembly mitochondrial protein homolog isoform X2 [Diabrotica virgifera virgifera]|uniref:COX assembly mitochondrial protein n=1 Tax=Diabrotica virgifera virgifera TaxID=50390 RepID=A0A6P7GE60_DIAVI|nr:COX assembly mitochondrial protein homolog isoform X2 [Diabrotica virgifera virgifera]
MSPTSVYEKYKSGPHGLDDLSLRRVEIDVMVPKKMREIARVEKCFKEVAEFSTCGKDAGLLMVFKCRQENDKLKSCLTKWYEDAEFKERCKKEYLQERSEYRRTGITTKEKQRIANLM